jgi:uncharacterized membrane protein
MLKDELFSRITIGKMRMEALSDGVFAIVMTLLVLELKVPDLPRQASAAELSRALKPLVPHFFSFLVTFLISGVFWFLHQVSFHWIHKINRPLMFINLVFLMFVSLLPFSTGMLGHFLGNPVGQMFYFGNALALSLMLNAHWIYARRRGLMTENPEDEAGKKLLSSRLQALPLAFALAFMIAPFSPQYSGFGAMAGMLLQRIREKRMGAAIERTKKAAASRD